MKETLKKIKEQVKGENQKKSLQLLEREFIPFEWKLEDYSQKDFHQCWENWFGIKPVRNIRSVDKLRMRLGEHFTSIIDLLVKQFELQSVGLTQVAQEMKKKIEEETKKVLVNFEELLGYKRLPDNLVMTLSSKANEQGKYLNRYPLQNYHSIPPELVIDAIEKAKPYFQNIEIWAIEDKQFLRDPVVIGIKNISIKSQGDYGTFNYIPNQYKQVFYWIASWGDDIKVEDLFKKS